MCSQVILLIEALWRCVYVCIGEGGGDQAFFFLNYISTEVFLLMLLTAALCAAVAPWSFVCVAQFNYIAALRSFVSMAAVSYTHLTLPTTAEV